MLAIHPNERKEKKRKTRAAAYRQPLDDRTPQACLPAADRCSLLASELKSDSCVCSVGATMPQIISQSEREREREKYRRNNACRKRRARPVGQATSSDFRTKPSPSADQALPTMPAFFFLCCCCCYKAPRSPSHPLAHGCRRSRAHVFFSSCRVASCYSLLLSWSPWFSLCHPFGASRFCCWPSLIARVRSVELAPGVSDANDMNLEAVAASKSGSSTVAFSWEHEPGVSKQSHLGANKPTTAGGAPRAEAVSRRTPASAKKQAPAPAPATTHRHRLRVPPPPGVPSAPGASPPMTRRPRSRGVRPAEDPFLAAYLACTEDGARGRRDDRGGQKLVGWAGLRLGLGLGLRGRGLSCKSSCGAVEECVVRLAKIPGLHED
jgi:hypothetical protein